MGTGLNSTVKCFVTFFTNCFSAENGKYIAACNEAGSKGSESPLKYHHRADGSDHILTQLWDGTAPYYGLDSRTSSTFAIKWNPWHQTFFMFSSYIIWIQHRTYAACCVGYAVWENCRQGFWPSSQVGEAARHNSFWYDCRLNLSEKNVSTFRINFCLMHSIHQTHLHHTLNKYAFA